MKIIAVDWGKAHEKRSAFLADTNTATVRHFPFDGTLSDLLDQSTSITKPVLIAIDAAIGFPVRSWQRLMVESGGRFDTFLDFLLSSSLPSEFFDPVRFPVDWKPTRPFISPPPGKWKLSAFVEASNGGFYRRIDASLQAQPIFVASGIPGSVGSGTRALWQEIVAIEDSQSFRVWPFQGDLDSLLQSGKPVIAEIYPKACYGIALAPSLPAPLRTIAKTQSGPREDALKDLLEAEWVVHRGVTLLDTDMAAESEDHFDALISAVALLRLFLERAPLESHDTVDPVSEGGVLGAASLDGSTQRSARPKRTEQSKTVAIDDKTTRSYPCPIQGCSHVFLNTRGGWDAHVASVRRHPNWHPEELNAASRKLIFKREFAEWFR